MTNNELQTLLQQWGPDEEVQVRISISGEAFDAIEDIEDLDGSYCFINDERSVLLENGKITVIADLPE